jgi:hypothetical protein
MLYGCSRGAPPISSNIKVGKVGGIVKAKRIAAIADAASLPIVMSGNLELGHGIAVSAHVAASLSGARYATDIFVGGHKHDSDLIKEDWDKEGMTIRVPTGRDWVCVSRTSFPHRFSGTVGTLRSSTSRAKQQRRLVVPYP